MFVERFAEPEKSNPKSQNRVMELKDELEQLSELKTMNQNLQSYIMKLTDDLQKCAKQEKSNHTLQRLMIDLLKYVITAKSDLEEESKETIAELNDSNQQLQSQIMNLKDKLEKAITAKIDL